ncbi:MAG: terpene cyclase/mutase family protein [Planctomycetes bacterium]|nr:terpene cyclase/mutase family protein [Planctomycetota bacterium]
MFRKAGLRIGGALFMTVSAALAAGTATGTSPAAGKQPISREELKRRVAPAIERALRYQAEHQRADGGWTSGMPFGGSDPAITALVAQTFIQHPDYGPEHPIVRKALDFILKYQQPDGGIYDPKMPYLNYSTSVALMALAATKSPALENKIAAAQKCLKDNQWVEGKCDNEGTDITPFHPWYGGAGYGHGRRPDLSNTQMMLEALEQSGLPAEDPAYQKALRFVQRCQMLSMTNDQPLADGATDGGFIYTPANGGHSMAGTVKTDDRELLRSYGSMTYAGFKSMLYANVDRDDPRVKAAWDWIRRHYTLQSNPNMPARRTKQGLYYYYHVFAKALQAWGEPFVVDATGAAHDWRAELADELLKTQRKDGSWVNSADRWMESNPHLVTAYSVLALQIALR